MYSELPELVDNWISCSTKRTKENELGEQILDVELNDLVKSVNKHHRHTKSCRKGNVSCRFNFPRLPSDETLIAKPLIQGIDQTDEDFNKVKKNHKKILVAAKQVLEALNEEEVKTLNNDLHKFIEKVHDLEQTCTYDTYKAALKVSGKGMTVVLKRDIDEMWVNNYNPHYLMAWQANMDIQLCLDSYSVITYITDYITKADAGKVIYLK